MSRAAVESPSSLIPGLPPPTALLGVVQSCLATYAERPGDAARWIEVRRIREESARAIAALDPALTRGQELEAARALLKAFADSGFADRKAAAEDTALADAHAAQGWPGLLAAMLLVPSWQWPATPAFTAVPSWLWADFAAYVFYTPQGFCAVGDAAAYGARYLRRLEELVKLFAARRQSPEFVAALRVWLNTGNCIPLYFSPDSLRRHCELRGRLLTLALGANQQPKIVAKSRAGRRLRVGFINRHFGPQTETYTTLPMFEQLDPEHFELLLFTHHATQSPLEKYARGCAASCHVLPAGTAAQVKALRDAGLDVAVFGTNVTAVINEVTQLALHRVAPLQVVNNSSCTTTGLPEIDLYVSGTLTECAAAPAHFTERLGLLPGPAHAFNYEADRQEPVANWTRAALGIPEDAVVFVSAANYFKIIPEMRTAWAQLLAAVPGSRLLLHPFNPNWSSAYPIRRFCAEFDGVLAAHGVTGDRLIVSTEKFPSRTDVKELLRVGDVYLDTFPFGGVNSLVDPLEIGLPVVAWEGETFRSRMGAALLRSLGLEELVATDGEAYNALGTRLAVDREWRDSLRQRIGERMARLPVFLDTLAASDAFGALLEKAHDEVCAAGLAAFRRETRPLLGPDVTSSAHRQAHGRSLLQQGRSERAVTYFLTAIQGDEHNASLWHDLAAALHCSGRTQESVGALQTCLRLDALYLDGWLLLGELSLVVRHHELLVEAVATARRLAPGDARVEELAQRAGLNHPPPPDAARGAHILVYTDDSQHGGVAQYNHSLLTGLIAAGYRVSCAQSQGDGPLIAQQRALGVRHRWIPYDTKSGFARTLEDRSGARHLIDAAQPDLIVFSDCCPVSNLAARDAALEAGVPYVVVIGFVGAYLADRFAGFLPRLAAQYARACAVVAVSEENLGLLRARFGLPAGCGQVIHNGRPEKFFAPVDPAVRARLRAGLHLPAEAVVCLTAARLTAVKGFLYQIEAAKRVARLPGGDRLHYIWAGEGEQRPELERAIADAGLGHRVHLLGHRWDVADWYDAADIFVFPSDLEGMPLGIMEAMAKGLPVVATAVSGIPEELGVTGQLLPAAVQDRAGLISRLVQTLHDWANDAGLRREIGEDCRLRAGTMFREELMVARTVELVRSHLAQAVPVPS